MTKKLMRSFFIVGALIVSAGGFDDTAKAADFEGDGQCYALYTHQNCTVYDSSAPGCEVGPCSCKEWSPPQEVWAKYPSIVANVADCEGVAKGSIPESNTLSCRDSSDNCVQNTYVRSCFCTGPDNTSCYTPTGESCSPSP